ncbi:UNVERIFIED_CONTAM: hypothetical protein RMT77_010697 [Armadillidium vulgare]
MLLALTSRPVIEKFLRQKYFFSSLSKLIPGCYRKAETHSKLMYYKSLSSTHIDEDFVRIYRFPHITKARFICRLKLYQTATTICVLPVHGYFYWIEEVIPVSMTFTVGVCLLSLTMLYIMGEFFRKFIGAIYYSEQQKMVRISHLSFFGKRKEINVPLEDLVPFSELDDDVTNIYIKIKRYSTEKFNLLLCLRFGGVEDKKYFATVFGSV